MQDLKEAILAWYEELMEDKRKLIAIGAVIAALIVAVLLMFTVRSNARNVRYENSMNDGYSYMAQANYENAVSKFSSAYSIKETEDAALALAQAYLSAGQPDRAAAVLEEYLIDHKPSDAVTDLLTELRDTEDPVVTLTVAGQQVSPTTTALVLNDVTLTADDLSVLSQLSELTTLSVARCGISDLSFLQSLTKLTALTLSDNRISNLSPLANLRSLRTLYLDNNTAIRDFSPLYSCSSLTTLSLKGIDLTQTQLDTLEGKLPECAVFSDKTVPETLSLGGVSFTTDVKELNLSARGITDISVLAKCRNLTRLDLSGNSISDLSALEGLSALTWLNLNGNQVTDISPLGVLIGLTYLDLEGNRLTTVNDLTGLTNLTELYLSGNPLSDFAALRPLTALKKLSLARCGLTDKGLSQIPTANLTELDIRENPALNGKTVLALAAAHPACTMLHDNYVADITLGERTFAADTQSVDASYSSVVDLTPVSDFTNLTALYLNGNGIMDFAPLKNLTTLQVLELRATGMSDCTILAGMSRLTTLHLGDNNLRDVYALSSCTGLTKLTLTGNRNLTDIAPLRYCTKLTELYLDNTGVTDLSALQELSALQILYLDGCSIADFTKLYSMSNLRTLYLIDTGIDGQQLYALQQALPNCNIYAGDVVPVIPAEPTPEASVNDTMTPVE